MHNENKYGCLVLILTLISVGCLVAFGYNVYHHGYYSIQLGIFALIFGVVGLFFYAEGKYTRHLYDTANEYTKSAIVISKTSRVSGTSAGVSSKFDIAFEFSDGNREVFRDVDSTLYNTVVEGEAGMLTYRRNGTLLFIVDFQRDHQQHTLTI